MSNDAARDEWRRREFTYVAGQLMRQQFDKRSHGFVPINETPTPGIHPVHAILLAFPIALFPSALVTDIAYLQTAQIQWSNFSAWLIAGALLIASPVVLWAIICAIRWRHTPLSQRALRYLVALAVMWLLGLINAFKHSADGWASVGAMGLILSVLCSLCALVAASLAFSRRPFGSAAA